ncbi:hypothetical protein BJX68DRAFT_260464 [Aspergillus pseudodeflectus]|uniref:Uncharacterized protein n=1 Tax=Aspergillus pseudodeflectus TaxID=176178 RepID=A0ABR4LAT8_9EURO
MPALPFSGRKCATRSPKIIKKHINVNIYGFLYLYQAFRNLLKEATDSKNYIPLPNAIYAPTKLVQHWYTKAISVEDNQLTTFPVNPG